MNIKPKENLHRPSQMHLERPALLQITGILNSTGLTVSVQGAENLKSYFKSHTPRTSTI